MQRYLRLFGRIYTGSAIVGSVALAVTMLLTVANVVARLLGSVIPGTYSFTVVLAVLIAGPSIVVAQVHGMHISIDFFSHRWSRRVKLVLTWISGALGVAFWALTAWVAVDYGVKMWKRGEVLDPFDFPVAPFRLLWGFALAVLCLALCASLVKSLHRPPDATIVDAEEPTHERAEGEEEAGSWTR
jgi:TRAP-type C4-dicarboxylate transport system permease small subunit